MGRKKENVVVDLFPLKRGSGPECYIFGTMGSKDFRFQIEN
jgi:hypothetical protein